MPYSQNGWLGLSTAALQAKYLTTVRVAGVPLRVRRGSVATVLGYVAGRFHTEVEPITQIRDDWSFAYRSIRGSSTVSNHASGTAIDLNAVQHPLGTSPGTNFTTSQRAAIRRILNACGGVVRWGGDYSGRKDPMHFELNRDAAAVKALAERLGDAPTEQDDDMYKRYQSAGVTRPLKLAARTWNTIPWDTIYAGDTKRGNAGVVLDGPRYDAKVRMIVRGLPEGAEWKARLVEARKTSGKWHLTDTASYEDYQATGGDDYRTLDSGPDSLRDGDRVWLQIYPAVDCTLVEAYAKAVSG